MSQPETTPTPTPTPASIAGVTWADQWEDYVNDVTDSGSDIGVFLMSGELTEEGVPDFVEAFVARMRELIERDVETGRRYAQDNADL